MKTCKDKTGSDKFLHFLAGAGIAVVIGALAAHIQPHIPWLTSAIALTAVIIFAAVKELRDARARGNHFCIWDFLITFSGGVALSWFPWLVAYLLAIEG